MTCTKDCKEEQGSKFLDGVMLGMGLGGLLVCILAITLTAGCVTTPVPPPLFPPPNPTPIPAGWGQDHWDEPGIVIQ